MLATRPGYQMFYGNTLTLFQNLEQNTLLSVIGTTYEEARVYIYLGLWYMPIYIHTTDKDGMVNKYKSLLLVTQPKYRKKIIGRFTYQQMQRPNV